MKQKLNLPKKSLDEFQKMVDKINETGNGATIMIAVETTPHENVDDTTPPFVDIRFTDENDVIGALANMNFAVSETTGRNILAEALDLYDQVMEEMEEELSDTPVFQELN